MNVKIQSLQELRDEMLTVARGERKPPENAGQISYESADAILRLLTPENRKLLALIEERKPESVAELAQLAERAESNVSRTLSKLVAGGFVRMRPGRGLSKVPEVAIRRVTVDIDVFQSADRVAFA